MTAIVSTGSEGSGKLRCNIHEFETLDLNEWHDHCIDTGHTLSGATACSDCGNSVEFTDIPYRKTLNLRCNTCFDNYVDAHNNMSAKLTTVQREDQPEQEQVSNYEAPQGVDQQ